MNVDKALDQTVNPVVWEHPATRAALARRDLTAVYRRLQAAGVSQRRIAALTSQSPSEVYEILNGRQVMAYDVQLRIADGLGVPRGYMGLAYDESTELALELATASCSVEQSEREEVRQLLSHAANVTMGATAYEVARWWQPVEHARTPLPHRVGLTDVIQIENLTAVMRTINHQHGGGACRDAVVAQVRWAQQLLGAAYSDAVGHRLHLALADLHSLAGWASFDVGLYSAARRHFARALEQARHANDASLVAKVLYCVGRLHLHRSFHRDALKFFQLGQIAAQDSGSELTVAMLCANEAWAYAFLNDPTQALKSIGRAQDEFARAEHDNAPVWVRFFSVADIHAMMGMVYASLPQQDRAPHNAHLTKAVENLTVSLGARDDTMVRSRTFELTALATVHLALGDLPSGETTGNEAVDLALHVHSIRTIDRMEPLEAEANRYPEHSGMRDLAARIAALRAT